jgi:hemerythrin
MRAPISVPESPASPPVILEASTPRFIVWMDILETGEPDIDADHRSFIDQYDTLRRMAAEGAAQSAMQEAFNRIIEHCLLHFVREEEVLIQSRFPRYEAHILAHRRFVAQFAELAGRLAEADDAPLEHMAVVCRLGDLLVDLLFRHDLDYKSHILHSKGR